VKDILIIDDDPSGAQLLSTLLEMQGYRTFQPEAWDNPVKDVEQHRPKMVIIDVRLRTRSGFDLLEQIRKHPEPEVAGTPVLMMSVENYRTRSRQAGAAGFIAKPFDLEALLATIHQIEEGNISDD
jgi:DNA-binding response OmpR family regulator